MDIVMEKAKIFLVEDNKAMGNALESIFSFFEFTIVEWVMNKEKAIELIENGTLERENVNIAIIDGYFPNSVKDPIERLNGPSVASLLKEKIPSIKIISFSSSSECSFGDYNVNKFSNIEVLIKTIKKIIAS